MLKDGKVHKSVAFTDVNAEDAKLVRELIAEVSGELPKDEEGWRELAVNNLPKEEAELRDLAVEQALEIQKLRQEVARMRQRMSGMAMRGGTSMRGGGEGATRPRPDAGARGEGREGRPDAPPPSAVKREGKPPEDPELNQLLRSLIKQTNDDATVEEVYSEISARAAKSEELNAQTIDMFKLMLSFRDRYGTAKAQSLAESFLEEHSGKP